MSVREGFEGLFAFWRFAHHILDVLRDGPSPSQVSVVQGTLLAWVNIVTLEDCERFRLALSAALNITLPVACLSSGTSIGALCELLASHGPPASEQEVAGFLREMPGARI